MERNSAFDSSQFVVKSDRRKQNVPIEKERRVLNKINRADSAANQENSVFLNTAASVLPCVKNALKTENGIKEHDYYKTAAAGVLTYMSLKENLKLLNNEFKLFAGTPQAVMQEVAKHETKSAVRTICFSIKRLSKMGFVFAILLQIPIFYNEFKK